MVVTTIQDEIFELIQKENTRQTSGIELIASENFVSNNVLQAAGSILTNKYAEGLPNRRYYGGCEVVDEIETIAINRLKEIFNLSWANVQPHSGSQANAAVMLACLKPGDNILGFDLSHGGHLTHGSPVNFSGRLYQPHFYGLKKETGLVDYDEMESKAAEVRPKLIIVGASAYSRDWDYVRVRKIADKIGALVLADISHTAGLIAKNLLNDPFDYCHIVTSTTHKTLRGPRGGVIMMRNDFENPFGIKTKSGVIRKMSSLLDSAVFPGTQGGPLEHIIAAKGVAFGEVLLPQFEAYGKKVISNARLMASQLQNLGYTIVSGGTDNHCFLVDLSNKGITGKEAEELLGKAGVTVNKNMVPFDQQSPMITSGIRIGTPAITTRGISEKQLTEVVDIINELVLNKDNSEKISELGERISTIASELALFAW